MCRFGISIEVSFKNESSSSYFYEYSTATVFSAAKRCQQTIGKVSHYFKWLI